MRNFYHPTVGTTFGLLVVLLAGACSSEPSAGRRRPGADSAWVDPDGNPVAGGPGATPVGTSTGVVVDPGNAPKPPAPPGCGDGMLTSNEACDDGNTDSGDGCNGSCLQVEPGHSCVVAGQLCRAIARCGDGIVADSEQCDDQNLEPGDGCSERCRVEIGKKCDGEPSVCTDAECGNGMVEGAESCDDGNKAPFDGCSALCLREPNCAGESCTSDCGDGLIINEDCDDGNTIDGDGCSSMCTTEQGFTCTSEPQCEKVNGECVLRVPAIFRDFSDDDPDFGWPEGGMCGIPEGDPIVPGIAQNKLDAEGRPVLGRATPEACIDSAMSFARWFRDGNGSVRVVGDIVLFDNGNGGFVNRFGENGEKLVVTVAPRMGMGNEQQVNRATSQATCEPGCAERVRSSLQCENVCRPQNDAVDQAGREMDQLEQQLAQAQAQMPPNDAAIAAAEAAIADLELEIADLTATAEMCNTDCTTRFQTQVDACVADCKPCSYDPDVWCTGGVIQEFDGTPLFFPVDGVMGPTRDVEIARLPLQYGYNGWPAEGDYFPNPRQHNFYFTSEVQYWFRYETGTSARLDFTGDDDVWVFVNGHLAVDLGGIHVPMDGSVTINAQTAGRFELQPGNVYKIVVFQAERKKYGSTFRLTLSGFEASPSDCTAVCGDGVLSFGEECDDGINDGGYGECDAGCKLGGFCGDGIVNGPEHCDTGPRGTPECAGCRKLELT